MIKVEKRASTVLYKFLISNCEGCHFFIPANVCSVVPLTFLKSKIDFSFVDIDPQTHAGSFELFKDCVNASPNLKLGVFFVNAYGARCSTTDFYRELRKIRQDLIIIEDNCLCIPETHRDTPNKYVDLEFYSTGYSKYANLEIGGGYGIIQDDCSYNEFSYPFNINGYSEQLSKIKKCRKSGDIFVYEENDWLPSTKIINDAYTLQEYLSDIQEKIKQSMRHKSSINLVYDEMLPNRIKLGTSYNTWRYMLMLPSRFIRDEILDALFAENLYASAHYQSAAYLFKHVHCENTENEANCLLNLFNEEKYSILEAGKTAEIINKILKKT